jgi:hypothetical protein
MSRDEFDDLMDRVKQWPGRSWIVRATPLVIYRLITKVCHTVQGNHLSRFGSFKKGVCPYEDGVSAEMNNLIHPPVHPQR